MRLLRAWVLSIIRLRIDHEDACLVWLLLIATVPAGVAGLALGPWFEAMFSQPLLVSVFLLFTAIALVAAEYWKRDGHGTGILTVLGALLIGLGQAAAIAPGISRSGMTMAVGLLVGLERPAAARFSFLLSIPVILGAGATQVLALAHSHEAITILNPSVSAFFAAAGSGYLCIHFLLGFLRRHSLHGFALYCAVIGLAAMALAGWRAV
jgi:undecaprenyl-diphosphatase